MTRTATPLACPACGAAGLEPFHTQHGVPTNSCLLVDTEDEARRFPTGSLRLGFCPRCGFITNSSFDPTKAEYSGRYEETQAFSPRFREFARGLAADWVERHRLTGGTVVEIGCGKGEFLVMMAEAGIGRGIGVDPGVHPERIDPRWDGTLDWIAGRFDAGFGPIEGDAVVCRHTLEHIVPVGDFVREVRAAIGDRLDTAVLFELPDTTRVLDDMAFWDVYYEHCSYFTAGSLARLFASCGFEVDDVRLAYDDQYLLLEARPVAGSGGGWSQDDVAATSAGVDRFAAGYAGITREWTARVNAAGGTTVIWGGGSKGVAFLNAIDAPIAAAVDVNPHKQGTFIAGTGHPVIAPAELVTVDPALVVAMNPIYLEEIAADLRRHGLSPELVAV
ncbi:MAG: methyltransferase domain-containing protein [Acidimicrobiia bacterium]|nr:methyltransferase domain-containing protein [Acidimicrobiia bacterium]